MSPCQHRTLHLEPSPFAELAGYERPDARKRLAATIKSGRAPPREPTEAQAKELSTKFPAPLVLPHDDLNYDPDCPPQSFRSWLQEKERNKLTPERKTLYVAAVPDIDPSVGFMRDWMIPKLNEGGQGGAAKSVQIDKFVGNERSGEELKSPNVVHFVDYLKAFYHGMDVTTFPTPLRWTTWATKSKSARSFSNPSNFPKHVALARGHRSTRIRVRTTPKSFFAAQLNLDDILDAAIDMLPSDAHSLVLLVDHDIYENEEDDFCCGRAYGGSRVAVVQTARYHPILDMVENIDHEHMWPASHCKDFVDRLCAEEDMVAGPPTKEQISLSKCSPMRAAITAASSSSVLSPETRALQSLWFSRLARTVTHELGHCFGMGHCIYYACNMQGTAGMKEDVRQPPYLCPVCLTKISHAVCNELQSRNETEHKEYVLGRYEALAEFCRKWGDVNMFVGFGAWIEGRLEELKEG